MFIKVPLKNKRGNYVTVNTDYIVKASSVTLDDEISVRLELSNGSVIWIDLSYDQFNELVGSKFVNTDALDLS